MAKDSDYVQSLQSPWSQNHHIVLEAAELIKDYSKKGWFGVEWD
jgi:hypothetical protein